MYHFILVQKTWYKTDRSKWGVGLTAYYLQVVRFQASSEGWQIFPAGRRVLSTSVCVQIFGFAGRFRQRNNRMESGCRKISEFPIPPEKSSIPMARFTTYSLFSVRSLALLRLRTRDCKISGIGFRALETKAKFRRSARIMILFIGTFFQ